MNFKIIAIEQSDGFYRFQWTQGVNSFYFDATRPETCLEPCEISKMGCFAKIVNG